MKRICTLVLFFSFIMSGVSDPKKPKKPKGCTKYSCNDWDWKNGKGLFDPHTIRWPLHYTGDVYKDYADGGNHQIDVEFHHYGKKHRVHLKDYRGSAYHKDPWFLDKGIAMNDPFKCEAYLHDEPKWKDNTCAMVQAGYEDKVIHFDGPGCSKIIREWTIIDWCKWEPNGINNSKPEKYALVKNLWDHSIYFAYGKHPHDIEHDGWYTFQQVIKVLDEDPPELAHTEDQEFDLEGECHAKIWLKNKVVDYGPCPGYKTQVEVTIYDSEDDLVYNRWLSVKNYEEFKLNVGYLPAGWYKVHYHLKDGCNNVNDIYHKLKIVDKNPPHLICIKDLSTAISNEYGATIWAKDFVHKATGPCYDNYLTYSFAKDSVVTSLNFQCPDGPGIQEMEVYVTASNGVWASCNVTLMVADHYECSDTSMQIAGKITTRYGNVIEGASAVVYGDGEMIASSKSNARGIYGVQGIPLDFNKAEVTAIVSEKSKRGIDAVDLIYMLRHVTGVAPFKRVEQLAVADINNDGTVDMKDYWDLTYIIYDLPGVEVEYEPWKFYGDHLRFSGITNHIKFTSPVKMYRFKHEYNLIGIKTGDVNFSWTPFKSATSRSNAISYYTQKPGTQMKSIQVHIPSEGDIRTAAIFIDENAVGSTTRVSNGSESLPFVIEEIDGKTALIILSESSLSGVLVHIETSADLSINKSGILFDTQIEEEGRAINWRLEEKVFEDNPGIVIRPNPFDEFFEISLKTDAQETLNIDIFDAGGRLIFSQNWAVDRGFNKKVLDGSLFRSGLHIVKLSNNTRTIVQRIIKN